MDIEELSRKVDKLEYTEIKGIKSRIEQIEKDVLRNDLLTEAVIKSNTKLSESIDSMKDTMIALTENVKDSTNRIVNLDSKVNKLEEKINSVDEKGKFDILTWVKNNFVSTLIALAGLTSLIYTIITNIK